MDGTDSNHEQKYELIEISYDSENNIQKLLFIMFWCYVKCECPLLYEEVTPTLLPFITTHMQEVYFPTMKVMKVKG
jgi:hypothetical protein